MPPAPMGASTSYGPNRVPESSCTEASRIHYAVMKKALALALFIVLPLHAASRLPAREKHAMVASVDAIASRVGADIMKRGGNAVDAAVAVAFALAVTWPEAGNLGGGGFILLREADGTEEAIDYRERAPLAATRDMYLDANGDII